MERVETPNDESPGAGRILYLCNWKGESGGIKVLYDHVRLLRRAGVDARLGAYGEFERCTWFEHDAAEVPAVSRFLDQLRPTDIVVLPEFCMRDSELADLETAGHPCRQFVFVQNPDLMTGSIHERRYEAVMVPSRELVPWIVESTGYEGEFRLVPGCLEREFVRAPRLFTRSRPRVLIIDRLDKNHGEPERVRDALRSQGMDVSFVTDRVPREEFVQRFVDHDVYLHLSYREGFPVSILESFGAGCLVIGFSGRGGLEFMVDGENCFVAPDGDWQAVVERVAAFSLDPSRPDPRQLDEVLRRARNTALSYPENEMIERLFTCFFQNRRRVAAR